MLTSKERSLFSTIIPDTLSQNDTETVNLLFKHALKERYRKRWDFIIRNKNKIYRIDYQFFFKTLMDPELIYGR